MISCYRNAETWNPIMDDTWTTIITCVILIIEATEIITTIVCMIIVICIITTIACSTISNKLLESQRNMENQRNILIAMITILKTTITIMNTTTTIMNTTIMIMKTKIKTITMTILSIARCKLKHLEHLHK